MKLIKKHMTLEEYETKYPKHETRLLSFSDAEIKEFNNKFYKNNSNKQMPDKYALLKKGKWVHINNRYYQIPRVSKLGKVGIALGGAAAVTCAVVLPLTLSGVSLTAEEFMNSITYISTFSKDRKFIVEGTVKQVDPSSGTQEAQIIGEMDGQKAKLGSYNEGVLEFEHQYYDDEGRIFTYEYDSETGEQIWKRSSSPMGDLEEFFIPFDELANNYKKFNKISMDTWEIKDYTYNYSHPSLPVEAIIKVSYQFGFNKDKTLKSAKGNFTITIDVSSDNKSNDNETLSLSVGSDVIFKEVKTHSITDAVPFVKPKCDNLKMVYYEEEGIYTNDSHNQFWLAKGYNETFSFNIYSDESGSRLINRFALSNYETGEPVPIHITKDNVVSVYDGETEINKTKYNVVEDTIVFTNPVGTGNQFLYITLKFNDCDYYYAYAQAFKLSGDSSQNSCFVAECDFLND